MVFKICITKLSNKKHHVELLTPIRETTDAASGCRIRDASGLLGVVFAATRHHSHVSPRTASRHHAPPRVITHRFASPRTVLLSVLQRTRPCREYKRLSFSAKSATFARKSDTTCSVAVTRRNSDLTVTSLRHPLTHRAWWFQLNRTLSCYITVFFRSDCMNKQ